MIAPRPPLSALALTLGLALSVAMPSPLQAYADPAPPVSPAGSAPAAPAPPADGAPAPPVDGAPAPPAGGAPAAPAGGAPAAPADGAPAAPAGGASAAPAKPSGPPDVSLFQETLALQSNTERWAEPGFRLALEYARGALDPLGGEPRADLAGVALTVGARLDPDWSALARVTYALASGGVEGLNLQAVLEPRLHLPWGLSVGAGVGLGAIIEFAPVRRDARPDLQNALVASYDHAPNEPPLPSCEGFGPLAAASVGWRLPIGPSSALTLSAGGSYQRVRCVYSTERVEPDTASPIERRQGWSHVSWLLSGGVMWR